MLLVPKNNTCKDAVSKAIAKALDVYYQSSPGGPEAELTGRIFQEYLNHFRRLLWSSANARDFLLGVEKTIGPLPDWVTRDLVKNSR